MLSTQKRLYRFADFTLDATERRLLRADQEVYLQPKTYETLLFLVQRHGHLIKKQELLDTLWADAFVTENALTKCIKEVREALIDDAYQPRFIKTIPRVGYKFIAEVEEFTQAEPDGQIEEEFAALKVVVTEEGEVIKAGDEVSADQNQAPVPLAPFRPPPNQGIFRHRPRTVFLVLTAGVALSGLALVLYVLWPKPPAPATPIKSIAVLPFKPLVADHRDESLELGMADTLIVRLSNLREVRVRPISSVRRFSGLEQDPVAAGRELGVESVLDGSIQRWGDRIRVTARLIGVGDGKQLWAEQFDEKFADVFTVQDVISEKVVSALALKLTGEERERLTKHHTENAEAYQLYVNGRYYWETRTEEGLKKAIEYFEEAIEKDRNYALAYAGLADAHVLLANFGFLPPRVAFPKAKQAALQALRIDDRLAEAYTALGHIKVRYDYDWAGAEREYQRAIELHPNYANAHHWYALYLAAMGRFEEGLAEIRRAQELEPLSLYIHANFGMILYIARRYDEAIEQLKRVLEMNPKLDHARSWLGRAYLQKGLYEEAIAEFQKRTTQTPDSPSDLGRAYGLSGRRSEALAEIEKLQEMSKQHYVAPKNLAVIYASVGDKDKALEWLEKAYEDRYLGWMKSDPALDNLRSEPRFRAVIKRMGLE